MRQEGEGCKCLFSVFWGLSFKGRELGDGFHMGINETSFDVFFMC